MAHAHNYPSAIDRIWQSLDKVDQNIIITLAYAQPPVTIDALGMLSGATAVGILNVIDDLKKNKFVYEKKEFPKGNYFVNGPDLTRFVDDFVPQESSKPVLQKTIDYYEHALKEGTEKSLVLAGLYIKFGPRGDSFRHINAAAWHLLKSDQRERAEHYFDFLQENINPASLSDDSADVFLDGMLGKFNAAKHLMPIQEQKKLLSKAERIAKQYEKWDYLTKIELALGQVFQAAGEDKEAYQHMDDFWRLAGSIGDQRMLKVATLMTSEFLHWKGQFAEVVRRYEESVEDLEEFGNDEATLGAAARVGLCYVRNGRIARGLGMIETVRAKAKLLNFLQVSIFADFMTTLALFDIRKISEAQFYIDRICSHPEDAIGHYILWPIEACKAYIACQNERYAEAFEFMKRAFEHSRYVGWLHQNGAWNFDCLDILESKGFIHPEWNYDLEIKRMLAWNDIYTIGFAYRYRAMRNMKRHKVESVLSDLKNSKNYLKQAGAEIELARTRIELGNYYLKTGEEKLGQSEIEKAWQAFSKVDKKLFPDDLLMIMPKDQKIKAMIDRIIAINQSLGTVHDASSFIERSLGVAMEFTGALRGAFFQFSEDEPPKILASRNLDPLLLKTEQLDLVRKIVADVAINGSELVIQNVKEKNNQYGDILPKAGIISMVCLPVTLGKETYGYLYLDNRVGGHAFPDDHLLYVRLLCSQIAVGIFNVNIVEEIREHRDRFEEEAIFYKREMGVASPLGAIIGESEQTQRILKQIQQVAPSDSAVLIEGETGVGKELVAKAIHSLSDRKDGSFIPVNLAALPHELVISELFGHEKGAYTGASERCKGRFELADSGTIFLDEIGDLPMDIQVKLLRVLQEGTFERVGSAKPIRSNFRVIAATNKNLLKAIERGTFRKDLYFRLNVFPIHIPPLRERINDIPLIAKHCLDKFGKKLGKSLKRIPKKEITKLIKYSWPGNVRELEHVIERSVILSQKGEISFNGLDHPCDGLEPVDATHIHTMVEMEKKHILTALRATRWKVGGPKGAAELLDLKPTTLFFRMKKLGIQRSASH